MIALAQIHYKYISIGQRKVYLVYIDVYMKITYIHSKRKYWMPFLLSKAMGGKCGKCRMYTPIVTQSSR